MDIGTALLGAILVAICIGPFIYFNLNKKKAAQQKIQKMNLVAKEINCNLSEHEACGDYVIGLDSVNNYIFFNKKLEDADITQSIDLNTIKNCKIVKTNRSIHPKDKSYQVIDQLKLSFSPRLKEGKTNSLLFFDSDENMRLNGELQSIENWEKRINQQIQSY